MGSPLGPEYIPFPYTDPSGRTILENGNEMAARGI